MPWDSPATPVKAQQETSSGHTEGRGLTTEGQLYGHRPAGSNQRTAILHPKFPQPTTGPRTCTRWFRHGPLLRRNPAQPTSGGNVAARLNRLQEGDIATRLNQLQEKQSWLSQHVSASERLSRNHPTAKKQIRPQAPGHAQDGFDTGRSFVATRLNQLREGTSQPGSTGFRRGTSQPGSTNFRKNKAG